MDAHVCESLCNVIDHEYELYIHISWLIFQTDIP